MCRQALRRSTRYQRSLLDTGGRLSEVAGLRVDDVDFDLDVLHVLGNGRRGRSVPFGKRTASPGTDNLRAHVRHACSDDTSLWLGIKVR
jgi:site-specific recombinase XerC